MNAMEELNVGVVGAVGRGRVFRAGFEACGARIHAVCDTREDRLDEAMANLNAREKYADYETMLARSELDAVVVGTPMPLHASMSIQALERGLHVMSEVPACVSVEECRRLVAACGRARGVYMMAENMNYTRSAVVIAEMVRQGLFGETYYAEGEYLHELKQLNVRTPWRRAWQTGVKGITYGTHSLGPILQWMPGDRVERVCCETTGSHYRDPDGKPYAQDSATMLAKTRGGALIKIRVDMVSDRPHGQNNYFQLQGVDGVYESARDPRRERDRVWLRSLSAEPRWHELDTLLDVDELAERFIPEMWRNAAAEALKAGHGGGDYFEVFDFLAAARGERPCPLGIHEAMDLTIPGLASQESAEREGAWIEVPDSRTWK